MSNYMVLRTSGHHTTNQASKAALIVHLTDLFFDKVQDESLEPVVIGGIIPLSMRCLKNMASTRVPGKDADSNLNCLSSSYIVHFTEI